MRGKSEDDYSNCLNEIFKCLKSDVSTFNFDEVATITIDFEVSLFLALKKHIGANWSKILKGCNVSKFLEPRGIETKVRMIQF